MPDELIAKLDEIIPHVDGLRDEVAATRKEIAAERVDRQQQTARIVKWVSVAIAVVVLVGVGTVGGAYLLIRQNTQNIRLNAGRLEQVIYSQCVTRNQGVARQNALLDGAIAAERRKPHPNAVQVKALEQFKGAIVNCGKKP